VKSIVMDASALMAFFEGQPGAVKVEEIINLAMEGKRELFMSVVNWGEVYYAVWRAHGQDAARRTSAEIAQLPIEIINADMDSTRLAAEIRASYKLPYADSFAASLARQRRAALATGDRDFESLEKAFEILWTTGVRGA